MGIYYSRWFLGSGRLYASRVLISQQKSELNSVVNEYAKEVGDEFSCTQLVEHVIETDSPSIKQQYYH